MTGVRDTFHLIPSGNGPVIVFVSLGALLLGLVILFGCLAWSSRHVTLTVSPAGLHISGDLFGRLVPMPALVLDGARTLDPTRETSYRLRRRTFGTGLPGYAAGWFRLDNGETALAFVTDRRRGLYLPTGEGHALLLSPQEPEALLQSLRRVAESRGVG